MDYVQETASRCTRKAITAKETFLTVKRISPGVGASFSVIKGGDVAMCGILRTEKQRSQLCSSQLNGRAPVRQLSHKDGRYSSLLLCCFVMLSKLECMWCVSTGLCLPVSGAQQKSNGWGAGKAIWAFWPPTLPLATLATSSSVTWLRCYW